MASFSGLGIGLSLVFGCLLLALLAELYYFLWWKKRSFPLDIEENFTNDLKEFFHHICWNWKRGSSSSSSSSSPSLQANNSRGNQESGLENGCNKDLLGLELTRLHNLSGPPRFLWSIKEETKEDLESEDRSRKGSRARSLSDVILTVETPLLSPLPSPPLKAPSPLNPLSSFNINTLFESSTELDLNMLLSSPPPSRFRFLREAEKKLYRRSKACKNGESVQNSETKAISNPTGTVEEDEDEEDDDDDDDGPQNHHASQYSSSSSQGGDRIIEI